MNDDFLHQMRVDPPAAFAEALKAKLDNQGVTAPAARRVSIRAMAIVLFLGGTGLAIALIVSKGTFPWSPQPKTSFPVSGSAQSNVLAPAPVSVQSLPLGSTTSITSSAPTATSGQKAVEPRTTTLVEIEWVLVPDGTFVMGATDEQKADIRKFGGPQFKKLLVDSSGPPHEVFLDSFYILKNKVTNQQYDKFISATGRIHQDGGPSFQGPNQPVVKVTWEDARSYCMWAGARLPSEAEWEMAARGTQGFVYPWGNTWDSTKLRSIEDIAHQSFAKYDEYLRWKKQNFPDETTADVGSFPQGASPYGILDMAGNAWEWVNDWFDPRYYERSPATNPKGPNTGSYKVLRGGAWDAPGAVAATWFRETFMLPSDARGVTGFRCAKDAT